ncbi:MAG: hypothetical protein LBR98_06910 [Syntrophomonadaceae bacterium]|jgi:hypothetical protein|nr:hypothetical protein [Syntrophomonadaceae bacterium]
MRDKKWVAEHRGGNLKIEQHKELMRWALDCLNHLLPLLKNGINEKIKNAINIGNKWADGSVKTGDAMKASREIIKFVRTLDDRLEIAISRAAGHAVATAHAADHSMGPVIYGLKAAEIAGRSKDLELDWQLHNIPNDIKELVLTGLLNKKIINEDIVKKYT